MTKQIASMFIVFGLAFASTAAASPHEGGAAAERSDTRLPPSAIRGIVMAGGMLLTGLFNVISGAFKKSKPDVDAPAYGSGTAPQYNPPTPPPFLGGAPPPPPDGSFVVVRNGHQFGPYTRAEAQQYLASGQILHTDLGRKTGEQQWLPIAELVGSMRPQSALPEPAAKIFVGDKYRYYEAKWASLERRNSKFSWNWAAFLFGPFWLAYRKMHSIAWAYICVVAVDTILEAALQRELIPSSVFTVMNIMFAVQGNYWYKTHVFKRVEQISRENPQSAQVELARRGGTSNGAAIGLVVAFVVLAVSAALADSN